MDDDGSASQPFGHSGAKNHMLTGQWS